MKYKYLILFFTSLSLLSCKNNEYKADWAGGLCHPSNYNVATSEIEFFSNGGGSMNIPGVFCGSNWSEQGESRWFYNTILPDSVFVSYQGMNDKNQTFLYEGGHRLPKDKLISLFKNGFLADNEKVKFIHITVGMAPGGRICVWADHIEIARFKIKGIRKIFNRVPILFDTLALKYLEHHPVDYSFWDKPDERFNLNFGFCSEDGGANYFGLYSISKEGVRNVYFKEGIDLTKWNEAFGMKTDHFFKIGYQQINEINKNSKTNLPVDIQISWKTKDGVIMETNVAMPKDLPERFTKSYTIPTKKGKVNFNRIVFGVEKDNAHCIIWLDGPGKQEKIMRFKGLKAIMDFDRNVQDSTSYSAGYAKEIEYYK